MVKLLDWWYGYSVSFLPMEPATAGWFALIGFLGSIIGAIAMQDSPKDSAKEKISAIILLAGALCSLVIVFQGFHLWNIGWSGLDGASPEAIGNMSAKHGGKGAVIVLIIQFLPQFLVFGYGGLLWSNRSLIRYSAIVLGFKG